MPSGRRHPPIDEVIDHPIDGESDDPGGEEFEHPIVRGIRWAVSAGSRGLGHALQSRRGSTLDPHGSDGLSSSAIAVQGVTKRFGRTVALDDVSLSTAPGGVCGLVGPNGAGKTTLIRLLLGLERPTGGGIRVLGLDPRRNAVALRERVGYVPDTFHADRWMTARDVLRFCRGVRRHWNDARAADLVARLGIPLRTRVRNLSRGTLVNLALVAAVAPEPDLLLLDEPMAGLDPLAREEVVEAVIASAPKRPWTILFSSHSLDDVRRLADSIAVIVAGRIVHHGPTDDLLASVRRLRMRVDDGRPRPLPEGIDVIGSQVAGREWTIVVRDGSGHAIERLRGLPGVEILGVDPLSLEEIFKQLARAASRRPEERSRP